MGEGEVAKVVCLGGRGDSGTINGEYGVIGDFVCKKIEGMSCIVKV